MSRKLAREIAMNVLYQMAIHEDFASKSFENYISDNMTESDDLRYVHSVVNAFADNRETIDIAIGKYLKGWTFDRLAKLDVSILRLATTEILFIEEVSTAVAINEAVNLAKRFSDDETPGFVNGVLGEMVRHEEVTPHEH
ncbi:transcription antitermination factor NusB [Acidaminobacter sp.]|uniref:transcription antitermination factor NusB n=1 Tax=Acidaminobacter sp. TaxID=1872102 RepID=UPI00137F29A0|nr:transcription antitermination factor NusB [Acidaminobacter sp.]MDK9711456.1 transcription antitermination factor NusB [Acidaminobacter sp.]MZQ96979.1 transcription antitermination factor NusB [Acidaminobacter sp.]